MSDETIFSVVHGGLNYKLKYGSFKSPEKILGEMSTSSTSSPVTYDGNVYSKVEVFDKNQYSTGVDVDLAQNEVTILTDNDYDVRVTLNVGFHNTQGLECALLVDGVEAEYLGTIQGRGNNKPVYLNATDIDPLVAGQVLSIGVRDDEGGSIDVTFFKARLIVKGA